MINYKLKYAILGSVIVLSSFVGFLCFYKIKNVALGNIIELNQNQIIQINKKEKINVYQGADFYFKYNNKNLSFKIASYYLEQDNYFITLNKYIVIENNIYNLFVNTYEQILLFYLFDNIFKLG